MDQTETLYFDVDATHVEKYGHQEGVQKGYVGQAMPESCYQYLLIYFNNRKNFLYGTVRAGSSHSQNDFCGYLERFLPMLKNKWKSVFRADSTYFSEAAVDLITENDAYFFIKAATEKQTKYREIYKRTRIQAEQMSLGEISSYKYACLTTNDLTINEDKAFEVYNKRANIENAIKELKEDYSLGKIVTENFDANDVITQVQMLTYTLVQLLKNEVLPPKMSRMRLSTLRTQVFNVPGCLVHWTRRQITRIQNIFVSDYQIAFIQKRLSKLNSWILTLPVFS